LESPKRLDGINFGNINENLVNEIIVHFDEEARYMKKIADLEVNLDEHSEKLNPNYSDIDSPSKLSIDELQATQRKLMLQLKEAISNYNLLVNKRNAILIKINNMILHFRLFSKSKIRFYLNKVTK